LRQRRPRHQPVQPLERGLRPRARDGRAALPHRVRHEPARPAQLTRAPSPMTPGSLVLVRHGESAANALGLFTGVLDVGLTPHGEQSNREAAARLAATGWRPDLVLASQLARSWLTAETLVGSVGGTVVRDWRLGERSYGALSGYRKSEVAERYGHDLFLHWRRSLHGRPDPLPEATVRLWRSLPPFADLPPAALAPTESLADVVERVRPLWAGELGAALRSGKHVLV